jgi:hypothetical protein
MSYQSDRLAQIDLLTIFFLIIFFLFLFILKVIETISSLSKKEEKSLVLYIYDIVRSTTNL